MNTKWCSHCDKTDHNDSECWSTRGLNEPDPFWFLSGDSPDGDSERGIAEDIAWSRAEDAFNSISTRGFDEWKDRIRLAVRVLASCAPDVLKSTLADIEKTWQFTPPDRAGKWLNMCFEGDDDIEEIDVQYRDGELWAVECSLGSLPILRYHEGLTNCKWRKAD